VLTTLL